VVRDVKAVLETAYGDIWVSGELANVNLHSSGHCYATLKDAESQMTLVMFRDDLRRLRFRPEQGFKVIVRGRLTLYPSRGTFQMVASQMQPEGKGDLHLAFEQLKAKLEKEGLFAAERKRPIPEIPQWIGVITSIDGAALRDILSILERRFATLRILIYPVRVQGEGAGEEIAAAIQRLNANFPEVDVLLVGRGGGSLEDLWAFNEEVVARALAASNIPTISCVGHETDFTIADFVADLRAATPSAAAELVTRARADLLERLERALGRLQLSMKYRLQELEQQLDTNRLVAAIRMRLERRQETFRRLTEKLHLLSPLATLGRGYAIAFKLPERRVLKDAKDVGEADPIEVVLQSGKILANVTKIDPDENHKQRADLMEN
jgi:exodeoxyribonuclease VII large subunit